MSRFQAVSIELDKYQDSLPQWGEALSTHVGRGSPSVRKQEVIRCSPIGFQRFAGRIEYGLLGDIVLAKLGARPYSFSRSLRTATPALAARYSAEHRAFAADPAGSVWKYIWQRRLSDIVRLNCEIPGTRIAPSQTFAFCGASTAARISVAFSTDQFGIAPTEYRLAVSYPESPAARHAHTTLSL